MKNPSPVSLGGPLWGVPRDTGEGFIFGERGGYVTRPMNREFVLHEKTVFSKAQPLKKLW